MRTPRPCHCRTRSAASSTGRSATCTRSFASSPPALTPKRRGLRPRGRRRRSKRCWPTFRRVLRTASKLREKSWRGNGPADSTAATRNASAAGRAAASPVGDHRRRARKAVVRRAGIGTRASTPVFAARRLDAPFRGVRLPVPALGAHRARAGFTRPPSSLIDQGCARHSAYPRAFGSPLGGMGLMLVMKICEPKGYIWVTV